MATRTRTPLDQMNEPERQGLKPGWAGMTRFKQLEDGRWVCFLAFDGRKARVLPSEDIGLDIRRDSMRVSWTSFAFPFFVLGATLFIFSSLGSESVRELAALLAATVAYCTTHLLGASWLRRRYGTLPVTQRTLAMEEEVRIRPSLAWVALLAVVVTCFGAGVFFERNDAVSRYVLLAALGIAGMCGYYVRQILAILRYHT